jgi:hypothetical protein
MKRYTKTIDGKTVIKERNRIVINKDGMQTINPTHEMLIADGWVEYVIPEPTEEELLIRAKAYVKNEIRRYDSSSEVNEFFINGLSVWLDKATRAGLKLRFEAEIAMGNENTSLLYNNMQFPLPLSQAMQMLYAIEIYASACYDNTQAHYANVEALTSIEECEAYDYKVGYPEKLYF